MWGQIDFPLQPDSSYSGLTDWRHVEEEEPGHRLCLLIGSSILNPLTLLKLYYSVSSMLMIEAIDTPWYDNNWAKMSWMRRLGVEGRIRCIFVRGKKHQKQHIHDHVTASQLTVLGHRTAQALCSGAILSTEWTLHKSVPSISFYSF